MSMLARLVVVGLTLLPVVACSNGKVSSTKGDCAPNREWGTFPDSAEYRHHSADVDELLKSFAFVDRSGDRWTARAGLLWDGCSIPRVLWTVVGSPKTGCHKLPSIPHDEYYKHPSDHAHTRLEVDRMFYEGCRANGIGVFKAKMMYYAVRWFGKRWGANDLAESSIADENEQKRLLERLETHLESNDMDLDELDNIEPGTLAATLLG